MAPSIGLLRRLAGRFGLTVDEARQVFRGINDSTATQILADQPSRAVGELTDSGLSAFQTATLTAGGVGATAVTVPPLTEYFEQRNINQERLSQRQFIEQVLNDPNLSNEQAAQLIEQAFSAGTLGINSDGGNENQEGPLPFDLFSLRGVIVLIVVYFVGKALVEKYR